MSSYFCLQDFFFVSFNVSVCPLFQWRWFRNNYFHSFFPQGLKQKAFVKVFKAINQANQPQHYKLLFTNYLNTLCDEWGGAESRGNGARPVE